LNEAWEYSDGQRQRAINYFAENREFFPIPDYGVPGDVTAFDSFIERLAADVKSNVTLFIHCMGGSGRTGIVAGTLFLLLFASFDI
jgi:protein-tyrosine phosphatase